MDPAPKRIEADCITTRHLSLVDDQGRERASLRTSTHHGDFVVFDMKDVEGRPRVTIQLSNEGTSIELFTEQNAPAISIGLKGDVCNGISIGRPGDGRQHIMLEVPGKDGFSEIGDEPFVLVCDSKGHGFALGPKSNQG